MDCLVVMRILRSLPTRFAERLVQFHGARNQYYNGLNFELTVLILPRLETGDLMGNSETLLIMS